MSLVILTGASGSGKTTIARAFANRHPSLAGVCYFDSIGVPTVDEMIRQYGSGEEWQRLMTAEWLCKISNRLRDGPILFEGQMRLAFIHEAAKAANISRYATILVDCDDQTRKRRLMLERRQAELASDEMMNWARYLRDEAMTRGDRILDTSTISVGKAVEVVRKIFDAR